MQNEKLLNEKINETIDTQILQIFNDCMNNYKYLFKTLNLDEQINSIPKSYYCDLNFFDYILLKAKEYIVSLLLIETRLIDDFSNKRIVEQRVSDVHCLYLEKYSDLDLSKSLTQLIDEASLRSKKRTLNKRFKIFQDSILKNFNFENSFILESKKTNDNIGNAFKSYYNFFNAINTKFNFEFDEKFFEKNLAFIDKYYYQDKESFIYTAKSVNYYTSFIYKNFTNTSNIFTLSDTLISNLIKEEPYPDRDKSQKICSHYQKNAETINTILSTTIQTSSSYYIHYFLFEKVYHTNFFQSINNSFLQYLIKKIDIDSLYNYIKKEMYFDGKFFYQEKHLYNYLPIKNSLFYLDFLQLLMTFNINIRR